MLISKEEAIFFINKSNNLIDNEWIFYQDTKTNDNNSNSLNRQIKDCDLENRISPQFWEYLFPESIYKGVIPDVIFTPTALIPTKSSKKIMSFMIIYLNLEENFWKSINENVESFKQKVNAINNLFAPISRYNATIEMILESKRNAEKIAVGEIYEKIKPSLLNMRNTQSALVKQFQYLEDIRTITDPLYWGGGHLKLEELSILIEKYVFNLHHQPNKQEHNDDKIAIKFVKNNEVGINEFIKSTGLDVDFNLKERLFKKESNKNTLTFILKAISKCNFPVFWINKKYRYYWIDTVDFKSIMNLLNAFCKIENDNVMEITSVLGPIHQEAIKKSQNDEQSLILNIEINDEANTPESLKKLMELIEKIFDSKNPSIYIKGDTTNIFSVLKIAAKAEKVQMDFITENDSKIVIHIKIPISLISPRAVKSDSSNQKGDDC